MAERPLHIFQGHTERHASSAPTHSVETHAGEVIVRDVRSRRRLAPIGTNILFPKPRGTAAGSRGWKMTKRTVLSGYNERSKLKPFHLTEKKKKEHCLEFQLWVGKKKKQLNK